MSELRAGGIGWVDLTVDDAESVRDFYRDVVGFEISTVAMGDYDDFCLHPPGADPVAGVCHARGGNAGLPPVWLVYFTVDDLDAALASCRARGGAILAGPKSLGAARYAVVRDPAGAASALFEPART
jgi:predicted enzyme related to lactoylglutathione lyase